MIFDPKKETFTSFRMPYPMPFYTRGLDGLIDDAKAGWKAAASGQPMFLLAQVHRNQAGLGESHSNAAKSAGEFRARVNSAVNYFDPNYLRAPRSEFRTRIFYTLERKVCTNLDLA